MTFAALLDADVLVPVALADTLQRAAEARRPGRHFVRIAYEGAPSRS